MLSSSSLLLVTALLAGTTPADWAKSFNVDALRTYVDGENLYVLVAAAGLPRAEVRAASDALERALPKTGRARVVMNDAALGDLGAAADKAVLDAAKAMPVQLVAVVRVFMQGEGRAPVASVMLYDKAGATRNSFTVEAGTLLLPFGVVAAKEATTAASPLPEVSLDLKKRRALEEAQDEYEKNYVWFADEAFVDYDTGRITARWTNIFQGKYRIPLEGVAFYETIGRDDLASSYRTRRGIKLGLLLGGAATTAAGAAIAVYGYTRRCAKHDNQTGYCMAYDTRLGKSGLVVGGIGLLTMIVSTTFGSHPVDSIEARKLADEYNKSLKRKLGLMVAERGSGEQDGREPALAFDLGPVGSAPGSFGARLMGSWW